MNEMHKNNKERTKREENEVLTGNYTQTNKILPKTQWEKAA